VQELLRFGKSNELNRDGTISKMEIVQKEGRGRTDKAENRFG